MAVDLDMIIEPRTADAPFGIGIACCRKRPQRRTIDLLEQLPPRAPDTAQNPTIVEIGQQFGNRGVHLGQAIEDAMAQTAEKPALDDPHGRLDFRLVARAARPCREHRAVVVGRHPGIAAVDLRIIAAGCSQVVFNDFHFR